MLAAYTSKHSLLPNSDRTSEKRFQLVSLGMAVEAQMHTEVLINNTENKLQLGHWCEGDLNSHLNSLKYQVDRKMNFEKFC